MPRLEQAEVVRLIREMRDKQKRTWEETTESLRKTGHTSSRTGKPLTTPTVRYLYFNGTPEGASSTGEMDQLKLIRMMLSTKADPKSKLEMIEQIVNGSGESL